MRLYNTLTRQTETFAPLHPDTVLMYTCGPTVYHFAHIGNLRAFIFYDILKRALMKNGYSVNHVMNITDVGHLTDDADAGEDKMEKGSRREGKTVWEVAQFYTDAFLSDVHALNILPPTSQPKATEYIPQQIALVTELEKKGFTYRTSTGIAFDTSKFSTYAQLSRMKIEELREGARVELDAEKKNPTDFYVWKFSTPEEKRQMEWESPWGIGFPGWHIECSAMAIDLLGETIDIHCGGIDHIPVHHTNEIAQSEAATGKPFSRFWLHNNFLTLDQGVKMAKSGENFFTLQKVIDLGFDPMVFRYMMLTAHYRSELEFSIASLEKARVTLDNIRSFLRDHENFVFDPSVTHLPEHQHFMDAINEDLNTPEALSVLHSIIKSSLPEHTRISLVLSFDEILGLNLSSELLMSDYVSPSVISIDGVSAQSLLEQRAQARASKNWSESDRIRTLFQNHGYALEDSLTEQRIRKIT